MRRRRVQTIIGMHAAARNDDGRCCWRDLLHRELGQRRLVHWRRCVRLDWQVCPSTARNDMHGWHAVRIEQLRRWRLLHDGDGLSIVPAMQYRRQFGHLHKHVHKPDGLLNWRYWLPNCAMPESSGWLWRRRQSILHVLQERGRSRLLQDGRHVLRDERRNGVRHQLHQGHDDTIVHRCNLQEDWHRVHVSCRYIVVCTKQHLSDEWHVCDARCRHLHH